MIIIGIALLAFAFTAVVLAMCWTAVKYIGAECWDDEADDR